MLVMGKIKLIKDFQEWKKMVQDSGDKIKEYGNRINNKTRDKY